MQCPPGPSCAQRMAMGTTCLTTQASTFPWGPCLLLHSRELRGSRGRRCLPLAPAGVSLASCPESSLLSSSLFPTGMPPAMGSSFPSKLLGTHSPGSQTSRDRVDTVSEPFTEKSLGPRVMQPSLFFFLLSNDQPGLSQAGGLWAC